MRDLEDQTLSQGCRYPAVALGSGMHLLPFWIHLQNIRQRITVILDYQNGNACLSVKILLSTSVLSYAGVTASQTNTKVFRKWSETGGHGFRADLCKHGGGGGVRLLEHWKDEGGFCSKPFLLYKRVCKLWPRCCSVILCHLSLCLTGSIG